MQKYIRQQEKQEQIEDRLSKKVYIKPFPRVASNHTTVI